MKRTRGRLEGGTEGRERCVLEAFQNALGLQLEGGREGAREGDSTGFGVKP